MKENSFFSEDEFEDIYVNNDYSLNASNIADKKINLHIDDDDIFGDVDDEDDSIENDEEKVKANPARDIAIDENLVNSADINKAVEYMYNTVTGIESARTAGKYTAEHEKKESELDSFLDDLVKASSERKEIAPDKKDFLTALIYVVNKKYYETALTVNDMRNEWITKLRNGGVPRVELLKDDNTIVIPLAHDIVLAKEPDARAVPVMHRKLLDKMKNITIDGIKGEDYFKTISKKANEAVWKANNLNREYKLNSEILNDYNKAPTPGFKVIPGKYKDGADVFEQIPPCLNEVAFCDNKDELAEVEADFHKTLFTAERFEQMIKSGVKTTNHILAELKKTAGGREQSKACQATIKLLEDFSQIGNNSENITAENIEKITNKLLESAVQFRDENEKGFNEIKKSEEPDTEAYKQAEKLSVMSKNLFSIIDLISRRNAEFKKENISPADVKNAKLGLKFVDGKYRQFGSIGKGLDYEENDGCQYKNSLENQMDIISDSLMNDGVYCESYDKLMKELKKNYRLEFLEMKAKSHEKIAARLHEGLEYERMKTAGREKIYRLINECKEFERTNETKLGIAGAGANRLELLDRIQRNVSRKPNMEDVELHRSIWSAQDNDRDELWYVYNYGLKNSIKQQGWMIPEHLRERYGFNIDGDISPAEEKTYFARTNTSMQSCMHNGGLKEARKLFENIYGNFIKTYVNMGKDYSEIYDALDGEENRELKARYLFNHCGARLDLAPINQQKILAEQTIFNYVHSEKFKNEVDYSDKNITFGELMDKLDFTDEDKNFIITHDSGEGRLKTAKFNLNDKVWDFYKNAPGDNSIIVDPEAEIKSVIINMVKTISLSNIHKKEMASLSERELKYCQLCERNIEDFEQKEQRHMYDDITDWIKTTGEKKANDLMKIVIVDKMQRQHAILNTERLTGVDPKTEIGRFYNNNIKSKNTYISNFLKDGMSVEEVQEKIITDRKYEMLQSISPRNKPVGFETYIELHTAGRGGETTEQMIENLSKVLAASSLSKRNETFDVSRIHKDAKRIREVYCLDSLARNPKALREALRGEVSARKCSHNMSKALYNVSPENMKNYSTDMKKLLDNMWDPNGRSDEYNKLYNAVKAASEVNGKDLTPEEKASEIRVANVKIFDAVAAYIKGKEKIRTSSNGNARFANALDALAIASKYAPGMDTRRNALINKINKIRGVKAGNDAFINIATFTERWGAARAKSAKDDYNARQQQKQNSRNKSNDAPQV